MMQIADCRVRIGPFHFLSPVILSRPTRPQGSPFIVSFCGVTNTGDVLSLSAPGFQVLGHVGGRGPRA
jgi:hypothetical protein